MKLLAFFETDCPTCRLTLPYLKGLPNVTAVSQDGEIPTRALVEQLSLPYAVVVDHDLSLSRQYDPLAVPALFLLDEPQMHTDEHG